MGPGAPEAIEVEGLCKRFGKTAAVSDLNFHIDAGSVVGFVGPNGAGKTTTLRILAGYLAPDRGRVRIAGVEVDPDSREARRRVGYLTEAVPLYPEMRVAEYLRFRARLKGIPRRLVGERVDVALERAGAIERRHSVIGTLSKGYRQRVGIADALLAAPPVLLLDEPTSGLDPVQMRQLRELIGELSGHHTILISSHQLDQVEALASRLLVLVGGRLVADGSPAELRGDRSLEQAFVDLAGQAAPEPC